MDIICDLHVHTIASGHAFNTIDECINYACKNHYQLLGLSDHGPSMEGASHSGYFEMLYRLPHKCGTVQILYGCEANILDETGRIDIDDAIVSSLDYVMAGLHMRTPYTGSSSKIHTQAIVNAILSNRIDIITHPVSWRFCSDISDIVNAAAETGTWLEANKTILLESLTQCRSNTIQQYAKLFEEACKKSVPIILGSDAHHISEMGLTSQEAALLKSEYGLTADLLMNRNPQEVSRCLSARRARKHLQDV